MEQQGWIKLYRKITNWEWYSDINVRILFIYLLLSVNHKENKWRGKTIKKGQRITSVKHLSEETGLSVHQVRTALDKLDSTNDITIKTTNKNTVITVANWEFYQSNDDEMANKMTNKRQSNGNKQE